MQGFGVKVGFFNELIYGCEPWLPFSPPLAARNVSLIRNYVLFFQDMIDVKGSSRHPLGQLAYRIISGWVSRCPDPFTIYSDW
jgi:hypothetical protein